jgi:hypothetical protein
VLWLEGETSLRTALSRRDGLLVALRRVLQEFVRSAFEYAAKVVERIQPDLGYLAAPEPRRDRGRNVQTLLQLIRGRNAARLRDLSYLHFNHKTQGSTSSILLQELIILLTVIAL